MNMLMDYQLMPGLRVAEDTQCCEDLAGAFALCKGRVGCCGELYNSTGKYRVLDLVCRFCVILPFHASLIAASMIHIYNDNRIKQQNHPSLLFSKDLLYSTNQ